MRFENLVSADARPAHPTAAQRLPVATASHDFQLSSNLRNAGFLRTVASRKGRHKTRASRRNFLRGSLMAASTGVAAGVAHFGPARHAEAQGVLTGAEPYRIWTACPSENLGDDCQPGCGVNPVCFECCDGSGFFRHDPDNGFRISPGLCTYAGGRADGWIWAYDAPCGNCATIEYRCHDGFILQPTADGQLTWAPFICRVTTRCSAAPAPPTPTPTAVAPPTPDPSLSYTLIGNIVSAIDNGNGTISVSGWIAAQGAVQTGYAISLDGSFVASGFASDPFTTGIAGTGPNHGFSAVFPATGGTHEICLLADTGGAFTQITCVTLSTGPAATAVPATAVPATALPATSVPVATAAPATAVPATTVPATATVAPAATATPTPPTSTPAAPTATPRPTPTPTVTPTPTLTPTPAAPANIALATGDHTPFHFPASGVLEVMKIRAAGEAYASGWGCNRETAGPVRVVATINGIDVAETNTTWARADITANNPGYGNALGFGIVIPLPPGGADEVCVALVDQDTGTRFVLGCREFPATPAV